MKKFKNMIWPKMTLKFSYYYCWQSFSVFNLKSIFAVVVVDSYITITNKQKKFYGTILFFFRRLSMCLYLFIYVFGNYFNFSFIYWKESTFFFVAEITHEHCITNYANLCICRKSNLFVVVIAVVLVVIVVVLVARVVVLDGSSLLFLKLWAERCIAAISCSSWKWEL